MRKEGEAGGKGEGREGDARRWVAMHPTEFRRKLTPMRNTNTVAKDNCVVCTD